MPVAWLSPLPPSRTGIAHYSAMLLPSLRERIDVSAFSSPEDYDRDAFDTAVYQLGNNPHHEWIYREAMQRPGIAVLHDVVLHHLIVEMTLARGDVEGYAAALAASHGAAGEAWARGRAAGYHDEIGNFLFPASVELANRSRAVLVHNEWAAERLRSFGVTTPIWAVPHAADPDGVADPARRQAVRARLGFGQGDRVIGFFGFLTAAKRAEVVLEAFERAADPRLRLLVVGEPAPNIDTRMLERPGIVFTGYVADEEFGDYYAAADRIVNLRYPSAGETSGTLIRAFAAGKPVAVSEYAQFAEFPAECVVRIPLGGETEVAALADFFAREIDGNAVARAQRAWLERNATIARAVEGYVRAIEGVRSAVSSGAKRPATAVSGRLPLFPQLSVTARDGGIVTVRNDGRETLRTREYGQPGYRIVAKLFDDTAEVGNRWVELDRDLRPGDDTLVRVPFRKGAMLRLYHALEGIPAVDGKPWYASAL